MGSQTVFSKIYMTIAGAILIGYLIVETRGMVFAGTDSRYVPPARSYGSSSSSSGRRSSSGWGFSGGFSGGK